MTMSGFPVCLALPSACADCAGVRGAQLGKMGVAAVHALVGIAGSGKTKAGFELGGRLLHLWVLFLSLLLSSRPPLPHTVLLHTPHFRHPVLNLKHRGNSRPEPPNFPQLAFS